ncbi:MAG TPA: carbohydrate kinase [Flavisolibacter sp.]|jgi:fructokinase|nr:carbohydrate kinase [Flavisolibacter sp.]
MQQKTFQAVCFGEVLWDLLPTGAQPGGAPMNVAYHLQKCGLPTAMISRVGQDERGEQLLQVLQRNGVTTEFVQVDTHHQTGIVHATPGSQHEMSYEIVAPVAWDFIEADAKSLEIVSTADYFICGSLAARSSVSHQSLLQYLEAARKKIIDINLRPPHYTRELVSYLLKQASIAKLNDHELTLMASWFDGPSASSDQVKWLQDHFTIPLILITLGSKGAMVCQEGKIITHPGFPAVVADTVGSGDSFLAAFISKLQKGSSLSESLKFANAMGAFIASKKGACPAYELEEVGAIAQGEANSQ